MQRVAGELARQQHRLDTGVGVGEDDLPLGTSLLAENGLQLGAQALLLSRGRDQLAWVTGAAQRAV